jgi:ABC-2 type transport system permease protein
MIKLGAIIHKELLLLLRDRAGLLVLFAMPAVLVLIITLVQDNVLKTIGESGVRILYIDRDGESVGRAVEAKLQSTGTVTIVKPADIGDLAADQAVASVAGGDFQLCIIVPRGISTAVRAGARRAVMKSLNVKQDGSQRAAAAPAIDVYFDPAVLGGFRSAVLSAMELVVFGIEVDEKMAALSELLPEVIDENLRSALGPYAAAGQPLPAMDIKLDWESDRLFSIRQQTAARKGFESPPTSVQQNVPAWSLFGIFFIVLPIAGTMIKERLDGTRLRLLSMPVNYLTIVAGKILAYILVCSAQFGLILCIGQLLLPMLGTPQLEMGSEPVAVLFVALCAMLAATGYGILLGTIVRTYEQASMFGPISVVIAAAIGGVMVPVYAMPAPMQQLSNISPLAWGLNAFLELFVRGGDVTSVLPETGCLLLFFVGTLTVSALVFFRRVRSGR